MPAALAELEVQAYLELSRNPGLTGCVPLALRNVPTNDLDDLPLPDCAPPQSENGIGGLLDLPQDIRVLVSDFVTVLAVQGPAQGRGCPQLGYG